MPLIIHRVMLMSKQVEPRTILYLTDNSLEPVLFHRCQELLMEQAQGIPIVSVSQQPLDFGINICLGPIGRSWLSLYKQMLAGLNAIETEWIVIAEHDCIYHKSHLHYQPNDAGVFWYNHNCWLAQWGGNHPELNGLYSYWPRRLALSQLICNKHLLKQAIEERLSILENGGRFDRQFLGCGEPGVVSERAIEKARKAAASGKPIQLQQYLKDYLQRYEHKAFGTDMPNLDIRHGSNFSGPKRGLKRRYELPFWGKFAEVVNGNSNDSINS